MRILYLTYGPQSGVIRFLSGAFKNQGAMVSIFNAAANLDFRCKKIKFPSLKPHNIYNGILSVLNYGRAWRYNFRLTDYAFRFMTGNAQRYIEKNKGGFDVILQSGVLFSASFERLETPYALYVDHTYAISKMYEPIKGLPGIAQRSSNWEKMEKEVYQKADIVFTMSEFVKNSLCNDYDMNEKKVRVVGAGPNLDALPEIQDKQYNQKIILFVGFDFIRKGGGILLKAFDLVKKKIPEARLEIVGPKNEITGKNIINRGKVDFKLMPEIYKNASLFVMPTLREPFGLAFLEAMAYGLPCIGTNIEAIPEIIDHNKTGFIVEPFDINTLSDKMMHLLRNPDESKKMGLSGNQKIRQNFNWERVAKSILENMKNIS